MVYFTCNACGQSIKKNRVEKHWQLECPKCEVLSCVDCGKDFYGEEYAAHTSCVSEAEKYQGDLFKGDKGGQSKGEKKQQEWIECIRQSVSAGNTSSRIGQLMIRISEYPNIPRKRAKFENFVKNSINVRDKPTLDKLWEAFSEAIKPAAVPAASTDKTVVSDIEPNKISEEEEIEDDSAPLCKKEKKKKKTVRDDNGLDKAKKGKRKFEEEHDNVDDDEKVEEMPKSKKKKRVKVEADSDNDCSAIMEIAETLERKKKKKKKAKENSLTIANEHASDNEALLAKETEITTSDDERDGKKKKKVKKAKKHKHSDVSPLLA